MRQTKTVFYILIAVIAFSACKNKPAKSTAKAISTDNGSDNFSCKIDGKAISGIVQYPGVIKPEHKMATVDFKTRDNKDTINLSFPNATGTRVVDASRFDATGKYNESNEYYHLVLALNDTSYMYQKFTVTVNSISDTRITGTFSGVAKAYSSPKIIHITDGQFDIPVQGTIED